jgi:hypothetical protein
MAGLWRNRKDTPEGKYLVTRRDGTTPEWSWFVLGARDPAAPRALLAYAEECETLGMDPAYVQEVRQMVRDWEDERAALGTGIPDGPPDRVDNPATIEKMKSGHSA